MDYIKVDGHSSLARDPITNSVINMNSNEYEEYLKTRNVKLQEHQKIENIESDLNKLKTDINEIKDLLRSLLK